MAENSSNSLREAKNLERQVHRQMTNIPSIRRTEGKRRRNSSPSNEKYNVGISLPFFPPIFPPGNRAWYTGGRDEVFHTPLTFSHVSSRRNALYISLSRRSQAPGTMVTAVGIQATHIFKASSLRQRSPHCRTRRWISIVRNSLLLYSMPRWKIDRSVCWTEIRTWIFHLSDNCLRIKHYSGWS